jgi:acyl-CoA synthetase (AMP-forming)/AMP-acid ligase II
MTFLGLQPSGAVALIDVTSGARVTYGELCERADDIAARLGDGKQLVFLLNRNDAFSCIAYAATQLPGHALALLDGRRPMAEAMALIDAYHPDWVIGPDGTATALREQGLEIGRVETAAGGELVATSQPGARDLYPDLAVLLATSGTTGSSKYVRLSKASVEANARSIATYLGLTPDERAMASLPLTYSFGLSILNSHWLAGATTVLTAESVLQRGFWDAVREHACSSLAGVPYTYQMLERIGYREMDLPSVRTMLQAGGALDRRLTELYEAHMRERAGRFVVMYGQTEATARIAWVPPERLVEKLGSAGIAIPDGRLRIDESGLAEAGKPRVGEVIYEGPNVMLGYAERRADLIKGDELHGVLHTGDLGYLDGDGFLFLTGRSKRIAKVYGLRVNLDEVERMLRESGPAAVVAGDGVIFGFCAFGDATAMTELRMQLSRRLRLHHSALDLRHVSEIPVSESGKVDYRQVERWIPS